MCIATGARLGTYTITSLIGVGGMGEVYQARDSKLERDVAIKVLPEQFARDQERLARFQREAKLLASLNHPNIATIHGLEQSGDTHYLVMELVPGETLRDRLLREKRVPIEEALAIAKQIAEALEAAHESEKGIIHRDLKPANVKVTPDGKVKVLDFGLAKAFVTDAASQDFSNSPTLSVAPTMHGVIMGTASYMSPEQARGMPVTKATDIFAFGAVLYELLTGIKAFQGEDTGAILATVIKTEPDWSKLPEDTPPAIRTLLKRCLRKERRQRLGDAGAVRIEIEDASAWIADGGAKEVPQDESASVVVTRKGPLRNLRVAWSVAAIVLIAAVAAGALAYFGRTPEEAKAIRFLVSPPETWTLLATGITTTAPMAVSPDGQRIAFVARGTDGRTLLWVRSLDTIDGQALEGTEGALRPFWSPDSRFLGFFGGGKLKKVEVSGGPAITLCDVPDGFGGTWSRDGVIIYAPTVASALQRVSASGGQPTGATTLGQSEFGHRMPFFLPDGRHFMYRAVTSTTSTRGPIYLASLDSADRKVLLEVDSSNVLYTQGHLMFLREATLMAQLFDAERFELTGDAFPITEHIQTQGAPPAGVFSASENGVLAYLTGTGTASTRLVWFDRTGKRIGVLGDPAAYADLELSPDGKKASVSIPDQASGRRDIWVYDLARSLKTRFSFDSADEMASIWSPDGSRLVFNSRRKGHLDLYQKASSGAGSEEVLMEDNRDKIPLSWTPDGRFILYASIGGPTGNDLFVLPLSGDPSAGPEQGRKPIPFLQTQFQEGVGHFSPDGRWIAYQSNESGRFEIYVVPFPGPGGKWQITTSSGLYPRWSPDGTEIFYLGLDNALMVAAVNGRGASLEVGAVKSLFVTPVTEARYGYDVSADGHRFLINTLPEQTASAPITVVVNWLAGLRK